MILLEKCPICNSDKIIHTRADNEYRVYCDNTQYDNEPFHFYLNIVHNKFYDLYLIINNEYIEYDLKEKHTIYHLNGLNNKSVIFNEILNPFNLKENLVFV